MPNCGDCLEYKENGKAEHNEWQGTCKKLGIGRHRNTRACEKSNLREDATT